MSGEIEIVIGDVSDMEARIYARYHGGAEGILVRGTLRGPYCENSRTLPAEFAFRDSGKGEVFQAEAIVPDPCLWSPELPHVYQVDVEALDGESVLAEYHGTVGLRRLAPRRPVDFAPGTG